MTVGNQSEIRIAFLDDARHVASRCSLAWFFREELFQGLWALDYELGLSALERG